MDARFVAACSSAGSIPAPTLPEVAVAGRSNCGKSSLINALTGRRKLARTSSTPGRTQQIIFFAFSGYGGPLFHLVDMPGYGYARASRSDQSAWAQLIESFLQSREALRLMLILMDIRRGPQQEEADLMQWMSEMGVPFQLILTKADKIPRAKRKRAAEAAARDLGLQRPPILFSVKEQGASEQLRRMIALTLAPEPEEGADK